MSRRLGQALLRDPTFHGRSRKCWVTQKLDPTYKSILLGERGHFASDNVRTVLAPVAHDDLLAFSPCLGQALFSTMVFVGLSGKSPAM